MGSRRYDKEFKLNAIALHKTGKSARQVCRDLGIPDTTFLGWLKLYAKEGGNAFVGSGNISPADQDFHAIRKELEDVRLERDILKKALAIFSKPK